MEEIPVIQTTNIHIRKLINPVGLWEATYRIYIREESKIHYGFLTSWIMKHLKEHRCLIRFMQQTVLLGTFGIKKGKAKISMENFPDPSINTDFYELRCSKKDGKEFIKQWKKMCKNKK